MISENLSCQYGSNCVQARTSKNWSKQELARTSKNWFKQELGKVPQVVERVHIRKVQTIQEEVVRRPVVKQVTREVIREIPKSTKVLREVAVDQMVEVPKIIEIPVKSSLRTSRSLRSLGTSRTSSMCTITPATRPSTSRRSSSTTRRGLASLSLSRSMIIKPKVVHEHVPRLSTTSTISRRFMSTLVDHLLRVTLKELRKQPSGT